MIDVSITEDLKFVFLPPRGALLLNHHLGTLSAVLSGLFFGLIGYFGVSLMQAHISISTMLFWRFFVSSLFIGLLLLPKIKKIEWNWKEQIAVFILGIVFYGGCSFLYFIATEYIGSGLSMVLFFTYPSMVMLINFLYYKEKISQFYYLAIIIIFLGLILLTQGSEFRFSGFGIILSLLAAICYASYLVLSKNIKLPTLISTLMVSLGAMCVSLVIALFDKTFLIPTNLNVWINIFGIGIICTALPILLLLKGLKYISSVQVSILSVLEPVFVMIFGILLLGENISLIQGLGVAVLLAGALLSLLSPRLD